MEERFYICEHCGNMILMLRDQGVPVQCCGEKMKPVVAGTNDGAKEKHVPVYQVKNGVVTVSVGQTEHPMTPEHSIEWVCLETQEGLQYKRLTPDMTPRVTFSLSETDEIKGIYAYCNQHSLWKA